MGIRELQDKVNCYEKQISDMQEHIDCLKAELRDAQFYSDKDLREIAEHLLAYCKNQENGE